MHKDDIRREFAKIDHAITMALRHHEARDESNAAIHMNDTVLYTPLTSALRTAQAAVVRLGDTLLQDERD